MSTEHVPLTVVASIRAQAGKEASLLELLRTLPGPTRKEEGCLSYDLHQATDDPTRFLFFENWRSKGDLDRHLASPHVMAVLSRVGEFVAEAPQITTWRNVG